MGLAALGLVALAPAESKADEGFRIYIGPAYQQYRPYYYGEDSCVTAIIDYKLQNETFGNGGTREAYNAIGGPVN